MPAGQPESRERPGTPILSVNKSTCTFRSYDVLSQEINFDRARRAASDKPSMGLTESEQ